MRILVFDELDSTNTLAVERANRGETLPFAVFAHRQRSGRGREDRVWQSPQGNLTATWVFQAELSPALPWYGAAVAVAACRLLREFACPAGLKWPNDLVADGRKLGGMLSEYVRVPKGGGALAVGLGLNLNAAPVLEQPTASLREWSGREIDPLAFMETLTERVEETTVAVASREFEALRLDWRSLSATLGQKVRVETAHQTILGQAIDLAEDFSLVLQTDAGPVRVHVGDCIHLRAAGL